MEWLFTVLLLLAACVEARGAENPTAAGAEQGTEAGQGSAAAGRALFTGKRAFQNGGPPCWECHTVGGLPFPNGGNLGPDLTGTFQKLGPEGLDPALQTMYFPTMLPIFNVRLLTAQEQQDLKAFFAAVQNEPPAGGITPEIVGLAFGGLVVLLALTWLWWRRQPGAARQGLVHAATAAKGARG